MDELFSCMITAESLLYFYGDKLDSNNVHDVAQEICKVRSASVRLQWSRPLSTSMKLIVCQSADWERCVRSVVDDTRL